MCARMTLMLPPERLADEFDLPAVPVLPPRYNIAPSQPVAVVGLKPDGKTRGLAQLKWGFVPSWANDPNAGPKPVNARAETVASTAPFNHAFRKRRCLVPVDGFYEWAKEGKKKVGHHFHLKSRGVIAFAGVWDVWRVEGQPPLLTFAVITVEANDLVRPLHDRMPAVIPRDRYDQWMGFDTPKADLLAALRPFPAEQMEVVKVGPAVNKPANDSPECLAPAA